MDRCQLRVLAMSHIGTKALDRLQSEYGVFRRGALCAGVRAITFGTSCRLALVDSSGTLNRGAKKHNHCQERVLWHIQLAFQLSLR
jgi:hypothetical protein